MELLKPENRHPHDEYIADSVAVARALGWTPTDTTNKYYIELDGEKYSFNLVYKMYMMIADNKQNGGCSVSLSRMNDIHKALLMTSKHGTVVILPFTGITNKNYNVSMMNYLRREKELDNIIIKSA